MLEVVDTSINTLPYPAVPPADSSILNQLLAEIQELRSEVAQLREDNQDLREKVAALESLQLQDIDRVCLDIAQDRRRISKLERVEPTAAQKDRADILRALLAANNGKMLAIEARKKMHMPKNKFSELLVTCDFATLKPYHLDNRKKVIILKSELVPGN